MTRLIDADKVAHEIDQLSHAWEYGQAVYDCYEIVKSAPTIDAEPVRHGHWIIKGEWCTCSVCKQSIHYERGESGKSSIINALSMAVRYCAGCGAKMDERKEE